MFNPNKCKIPINVKSAEWMGQFFYGNSHDRPVEIENFSREKMSTFVIFFKALF